MGEAKGATMKWKRGAYRAAVRAEDGGVKPLEVEGYVSDNGLFGVDRRSHVPGWYLIHLRTGHAAGCYIQTRAKAEALAQALFAANPKLWESGEFGVTPKATKAWREMGKVAREALAVAP